MIPQTFKDLSQLIPEDAEYIIERIKAVVDIWADQEMKMGNELLLYEFLAQYPEWNKPNFLDTITARIDHIKHTFGD